MAEKWLAQRQTAAAALETRARSSGMIADRRLMEQYVRKTDAMATVEAALRRLLPADCRAEHGLTVPYRGHEIYLEHVVTGPGGIFLIETLEDGNPWRKILGLDIAFLTDALGPYAHLLRTLVLAAEPVSDPLPAGALAVPSVEEAVALIARRSDGEPLSPALARHVWTRLTPVLAPPGPRAAASDPIDDRDAGRLAWFSVCLIIDAALLSGLRMHPIRWPNFLFWCLLFAPATGITAMLRLAGRREVRLKGLRVWNRILLLICAAMLIAAIVSFVK